MILGHPVRWMASAAAVGLLLLGGGAALSAQEEQDTLASRRGWTKGPVAGELGGQATIDVPEGYYFLDGSATRSFLQATENVPSGRELGAVVHPGEGGQAWFALFSFAEEGYVDDSDKDAIDADALLASMKKGTEADNAQRQKRGWEPFHIDGWQTRPFYDTTTHNLTWAIRGSAGADGTTINHSVRLLGRRGVMSVALVADQDGIAATTSDFNQLLTGFAYKPGQRYSEFRQGDRTAGYGLAALIGGGAAAAAVKTGLLQKAWKAILALIFAALAGLKKLFGGSTREEPAPYIPPVPPPSAS